ncbi:hypothetical protein [Enterovirga rhinocerotis]|uniref:Ryanodine receptor Ryr domain-containing protein n=1 Tax=Enterovirga rhinocerotis TaxID=1339210 RepID=A0A4R7C5X8_9HYPH|nr:hypothetical protein [Enterovirga rhinocerotis]TDR93964.1 hypothetical protein EV668_1233 [Enterovirga rhinocerotis]
MRDHVVVIGDSRVARALARQQARNAVVVHAGLRPIGTGADGEGIVEIPLDSDPETLHRAAGSAEASFVGIDLADDAATVAVLAALVEATRNGARPQIAAHLRDAALRRVVDDNLFAAGIEPRPRLVGTASLAARDAVAAIRPHDLAYWRGQTRLHAVVIGFSTLGHDCFEELVLAGIAGGLDRPQITILDRDPLGVRKRLNRDMPEIEMSADIGVAAFDRLTLTAEDGPLVAAAAIAPLTLIVVALDEAEAVLSVMNSLARMQEGEGQAIAAVLVLTEGQPSLFELAKPAARPRDLGRSFTVRGGIEGDPDLFDLIASRADELAERIHETYRARFGASGPAGVPWAALPETYRRANRRAADHLPAKLWTIGLREPGASADPFAVDPHSDENVIKPCAASTAEDALLRRLSRIEHDRWSAERRLDGWRFGEVRDDRRRIHPKLIGFDDPRFTDEDIEKDADQVRFLFGHVVKAAPDGSVTPLVIGILSAPHPTPGIDVASAAALCGKEDWRPVVIVSGLVDSAECTALASLDRDLTAAGRSWRLVVPEVSRDNREIRAIVEPGDLALLRGFLERPSTLFAPIGGVSEPADLWADPSAPDPHIEAIAAYIAARASAIVDTTEAV